VRVRTFLWFDDGLADALDFYARTFGDRFVLHGSHRGDDGFMTADFEIAGHEFIGMNIAGGPARFNESISISVETDGQEETDRIWEAITTTGEPGRCGWCKDQWGLSWQVSPRQMRDYLENSDPEISAYAWNALRAMDRIIIADLIRP
jgi:2-polyprenyl-6-hydroxyphenyl methylase/3-demethylubiquinone-9 3-methyltransferase